MSGDTAARPLAGTRSGAAGINLVLATAAFALTFWAWNLIGPLARTYSATLALSPAQTSLLVALPILVGSLGRIPVGTLTDRFGGRLMMAAVCFVSVVPVLLAGVAGDSFALLLLWGSLLGIAGTSFAAGIPFVSAWYGPARRGFATGVFGAGMGGAALSAFCTPHLVRAFGLPGTHTLMAAALAVMGVVMLLGGRDASDRRPGDAPALLLLKEVVRSPATWRASLLYAVAFGGFVAFSTSLPTLLQTAYGFAQTDAGMRTAGFSVAAVLARPAGGVLSDRFGAVPICLVSFVGATVLAVVLAFRPPAEIPAGVSFVLMALFLGLGTGGVFALVAVSAEPARVGTVAGLAGAAGGLGGFFPPLVMGVVYQSTGAYTIGFVLLAATALAAAFSVSRVLENTGRRG